MRDIFHNNNQKRREEKTNKKVLIGIISVFSILVLAAPLAFADGPIMCFHKEIWNGPTTVPLNTDVQWRIAIMFYTPVAIQNAVVKDNLGAELEIDSPFTATHGTASYVTQGGSDQVRITWNIGDVPADTTCILTFWVSTDLNPAGHQEYTSCGCYALNSGATIKYYYMGVKYSATADPIYVTVTG
jgi:hypothetical protein